MHSPKLSLRRWHEKSGWIGMILNENEESSELLFDLPDKSGYQTLDIAYSFGKDLDKATQAIISSGGKTAPDGQANKHFHSMEHERQK